MLLAAVADHCPDCIMNIPNTDTNTTIGCVVTVIVGAIIRFIELRRIKKNQDKL